MKDKIKLCTVLEPKWIQSKFKSKILRNMCRVLIFPFYLICFVYVTIQNYIYIPYIEVPITTKCSLKCKACGNLMQYYTNAYDLAFEEVIDEINRLLAVINKVRVLTILGGEPFIHKDLDKICEYLLKQKKIDEILIITNGTIVPQNANLYKVLEDKRARVKISNYGELSIKSSELEKVLKEHNIRYEVVFDPANSDNFWIDYGDFTCRNRTNEELKMQYSRCANDNVCRSYLKGKLHKCPRSSHGMDLSCFKVESDDYIDFYQTGVKRNELKQQLIKWEKNVESVIACNYCDWGTNGAKQIPVAEQMRINNV